MHLHELALKTNAPFLTIFNWSGGCFWEHWAHKHSSQGFLTYLAAARPSSIRHRHTSRGCLWRTLHRETGGKTTVRRQRATHERSNDSRDKLCVLRKERGAAGWSHCRQHFISAVCLSWEERQEFLGEQLRVSGHQIHINLRLQPH